MANFFDGMEDTPTTTAPPPVAATATDPSSSAPKANFFDGMEDTKQEDTPSFDPTANADYMPAEGTKRILQRIGHGLAAIVGAPMDLVQSTAPTTPEGVSQMMSSPEAGGVYVPPSQLQDENKTPFGAARNPEMAGNEQPSPLPGTSSWIYNKLGDYGINIDPGPAKTGAEKGEDIVGDVLLNAPLMGVGAGARAAEAAPSVIAKAPGVIRSVGGYLGGLARSAFEGAVGGGVTSAAETPGSLSDRAQAGAEGAVAGAVAAPVLHATGDAVSGVANRVMSDRVAVPGMPKTVSQSTASNAGQTFADKLGPDGQIAVRDAATAPATAGYTPTVAQAAPNSPGAVTLEQTARKNDPGGFAIKARQQADSERGAINTQGGTGAPGDVGTQLQNSAANLDAQGKATIETAAQARQQSLGTTPPSSFSDQPSGFTGNEQYGADTRGTLLTARKAMEDQRTGLQSQINQDGNVVIPTNGISGNVEERYSLGKYDKAPTGDEADILDSLKSLPANAPMSDLQALRNRVSGTIDDLTPAGTRMGDAARRLMSVKQSIDQAIDDAANNPTVSSPLLGDQRVMTPAEGQVHQQVKALSQKIASTYDSGTVGDLFAFGDHPTSATVAPDITRAKGGFRVSDADVLGHIWDGSGNEAANIRQFTDAGGNPARLQAFAADDLRRVAVDPATGAFDASKFAQWKQQHRAGLNATPELRNAFDGVEQAQRTVEQATQAHADAVDAFNTGAVKKFTGQNPDDAVKTMFTKGDSAANLNEILAKTNNDPAASAGLKRAVGDFIADQYSPLSSTGGRESDLAKAGKFNDFLTTHQDALTKLYGQAGYDQLSLVGKQMTSRANVSPALTVAAPSSAPGAGTHPVTMGGVIGAELGGHVINEISGHVPGLKTGVAVTIGTMKIVDVLRKIGMKSQGQLLDLMAREPTTVGVQIMDILKRPQAEIPPQVMRRLGAAVGAATAGQQTNP